MNRTLKAIKNCSESLRKSLDWFYNSLIELINISHRWMIKNPKNTIPLEGLCQVLIGIDGIILSEFIMPNVLISLINIKLAGVKIIIPIMMLIMGILVWCVSGIFKTMGNELKIPIKYKFLTLLSSIPLLIFINKIISENYGKQQDNISD